MNWTQFSVGTGIAQPLAVNSPDRPNSAAFQIVKNFFGRYRVAGCPTSQARWEFSGKARAPGRTGPPVGNIALPQIKRYSRLLVKFGTADSRFIDETMARLLTSF